MPPNATLKYVVSSALLLGAACGPSEPDNVNTVAPETHGTAVGEEREVETEVEPDLATNPGPPEPEPELPDSPQTESPEEGTPPDEQAAEQRQNANVVIPRPQHTVNPTAPIVMRPAPRPEIAVNPAAPTEPTEPGSTE